MKRIIITLLTGSLMLACGAGKSSEAKKHAAATLYEQLKSIGNNGVLFGHQDDLAYGIGWKYEEGRSDTYETAGDYPALFGWELGGIELDRPVNLDSIPFHLMRHLAVKGYNMGGVLTFSWHPFSPLDSTKNAWTTDTEVVKHILPGGSHHQIFKQYLDRVADFLASLQTNEGIPVPFIFRPWHEMDGDWFWWGSSLCSPEEFKQLFRFTIEYLRNQKGLDFLSAYSPDNRFNTEEEYLTWYPGNDVVDIIGVDNYGDFRVGTENIEAASHKLEIVVRYAEKTGKVAAFTESGLDKMTDLKWFTQKLGRSIFSGKEAGKIAYVMLWRNADTTHFFSTYPEHPSATDFKAFVRNEKVWLLKDWNQFKQKNNLD
ncbi:glycoside hydrolase family 26 protein [Thermophagus sp. OGC60D27]|uniref:glycoside hydrolase family 26 protein n=1 Tax=Thermophagus sp. OGC60D27 TaxID=3458415 RepID=UPI004037AAFC